MTWTISTLMDDPTHLHTVRDTHEDDHELTADPHPDSVQATDAEYRAHFDSLTESPPTRGEDDQEDDLDAAGVNAGLAWAAQYRRFMGPLDPTDADLQRAYDRAVQGWESPVPVERLAQVNAMALDYYQQQLTTGGWARGYLADRFGQDIAGHPHVRPGYTPPGWTRLLDHLGAQGVTDTELQNTGLATTTQGGRLIDRFRDRVLFPITDTGGQVLGFVGRRNPAHTDNTPHAGPKYLNTPTTVLFSKGHQLYGADADLLAAGATPVLVEGPTDAHAITLATRGTHVGVAPLGTALSSDQAAQLARLGGPVIVAAGNDVAGRVAAERAHWLLAQHNVPTFAAPLPEGSDPAGLLHDHGAHAVTTTLLASMPLSKVLLQERLANLPTDEALEAAAVVLAAADPAGWDRTCQEIADRLGTDTTRRALCQAVRAWHDDPHTATTSRWTTPARSAPASRPFASQTPEQRWRPTADRLDPRLTGRQDWAALAATMQHLHDQGPDVQALARASIATEPLVSSRPAQSLRYRLAVTTSTVHSPPHAEKGSRPLRRDVDHRIIALGQDRSQGVPR